MPKNGKKTNPALSVQRIKKGIWELKEEIGKLVSNG